MLNVICIIEQMGIEGTAHKEHTKANIICNFEQLCIIRQAKWFDFLFYSKRERRTNKELKSYVTRDLYMNQEKDKWHYVYWSVCVMLFAYFRWRENELDAFIKSAHRH